MSALQEEGNSAPVPKTVRMYVTVDIAKSWLSAANSFQRGLSDRKMRQYALAMTKGEWQETPNLLVAISSKGEILDGQHRLRALVFSGKAQFLWVCLDCPESVFEVTDRGLARTLNQILKMNGTSCPASHLSALHSLRWKMENIGTFNGTWSAPDTTILLNMYKEELGVSFPKGAAGTARSFATPFRGAILRQAIRNPEKFEELSDFTRVCLSGLILPESKMDPTIPLILRSYLQSKDATAVLGRRDIFYSTLKAADLFFSGKTIRNKKGIYPPKEYTPDLRTFPEIPLDNIQPYESIDMFLKRKLPSGKNISTPYGQAVLYFEQKKSA